MKKGFLAGLIALVFSSIIVAQEDILTLNRYAMVIGNQNYEEYPLSATINDAKLVAKTLENKGFDVYLYTDLTADNATQAFDDFISLVNKDDKAVSMIYYGGHGYSDGDENFLIPVDNGDIHTEEAAKNKAVSMADISDRLYSKAQIYVLDAGYDNPFSRLDTRGLGIKGSLSAARSKKEKTVCYLYSAQPESGVLEVSGTNSTFAKILSKQIETNPETVDLVFGQVKELMEAETSGEQVPYISATGMTFAFGGEQLSRLEYKKQNEKLEEVKKQLDISIEEVRLYEEDQLALYADKIAQAATALEKKSAELEYSRLLQKKEDERRAQEEVERAKIRKASENAEIEQAKEKFASLAENQKMLLSKKSGAEDKIALIEEIKHNILDLRLDIEKKIADYNEDKDQETAEKVYEINNREYRITETDSEGNPTKSALSRREKECKEVRTAAEKEKVAREKELRASIKATDKNALAQLQKAYKNLEAGTYTTNSFTDDLVVRIGNFDGETGTWPLTITSRLFGETGLFKQVVPLSYTDVTGKKFKSVNKMNKAQFAEFNETVELYDSLFRCNTDVFYVKLTYKIEKWSWPSQYRFEPKKCEIIRLDKKNKVIHTEKADELKKMTFTVYPVCEIRTDAEIAKEQKNIAKKIEKEEKAAAKKSGENAASAVYDSESIVSSYVSTGTSVEGLASVAKGILKQKGRGALLISAATDFAEGEIKNFDFANIGLDNVYAELDFAKGKFSFIGINGFSVYPIDYDDLYWGAGMDFGFNARFGKGFRPYLKAAVDFDNQFNVFGKAGFGLDYIFAKVLELNLGIDYGIKYNYGSLFGLSDVSEPFSKYHTLYVGTGFAW